MKKYLLTFIATLAAFIAPAFAQLSYSWTPVPMDSTWDAVTDPTATQIISKYAPKIAPLDEIIGYSADEYDKQRPESGLSNLAADIIREVASDASGKSIDVALTNFGGIRTSLPKGAVRVYDIYSIFPFNNYVVWFDVSGSDLRRFCDNMASSGRIEAISGISLEVDGRTISSIKVGGSPLDDAATYSFATINFLLDGGDGLTLRSIAKNMVESDIWIRDAIVAKLRERNAAGQIIELAPDGRVKLLNQPERRGDGRKDSAPAGRSEEARLESEAVSPDLVIVHTNDTHSQIDPLRVGWNRGLGGVERRLQYVNSIRKEYGRRNVLLLDGGDFNQGTPYYTMAGGDLEMELVNALGYDVLALGNHEFDNGQEDLARRLKKAKYQTVCCNYDFTGTPLERYVKPYTIVRRGGLKIGVIGVTSYLAGVVLKSHLDGMVRLDSVSEVNRWADYLKNRKHCDLVILLSHFGYDGGTMERPSDVLMVENSRNLDLVVGGHSHTYLSKTREVKDLDGRVVPIAQSGGQGIAAGTWKISLSRP